MRPTWASCGSKVIEPCLALVLTGQPFHSAPGTSALAASSYDLDWISFLFWSQPSLTVPPPTPPPHPPPPPPPPAHLLVQDIEYEQFQDVNVVLIFFYFQERFHCKEGHTPLISLFFPRQSGISTSDRLKARP